MARGGWLLGVGMEQGRHCDWELGRLHAAQVMVSLVANPRRNIEGESPLQGRTYSLGYGGRHYSVLVSHG